jgi:nucleoside-diphosphate-sugar epimerase
MRLAVTGATGFVGSHLLDAAVAAGHEVAALTRREQPARESVTWVAGDLHNRAGLERLVDGADALIHVAGVISARGAAGFEQGYVEGTVAMLADATAGVVRRFVNVS